MTALTKPRVATFQSNTGPMPEIISYRVKGSTTIYKGALVILNAGYAAPGSAATGLVAVGRADETVINAGADGDKRIKVRQGAFDWNNATSTDACAAVDVGTDVYILDDNTVTHTSTGHSKAGKLIDILSNGQCIVHTALGI